MQRKDHVYCNIFIRILAILLSDEKYKKICCFLGQDIQMLVSCVSPLSRPFTGLVVGFRSSSGMSISGNTFLLPSSLQENFSDTPRIMWWRDRSFRNIVYRNLSFAVYGSLYYQKATSLKPFENILPRFQTHR